ncbi:MAG: thiamine pyrophosphate-dependent enzyme [Pseudomonadota bacterium]
MSVQVKTPEKLPEITRRAVRTACCGTLGAVHLQIPEDILQAEIDPARVSLNIEEDCKTFPAYPTRPAAGLVERLNLPVCTTMTGQGTTPNDHRRSIGVISDNGYHAHAKRAMEASEFVLFVGSRMGSVVTIAWTFPRLALNKRMAQIDINPEAIGIKCANAFLLKGDAAFVLKELLVAMLEASDTERLAPWVDHLNGLRAVFWENAQALLTNDSTSLRPERAVLCFNEALDASGQPAQIYAEAGTQAPHMTRFLKINDRGTRFAIPRAFGGIGSALLANMGAWRADPTRRPIGLFGDGSFAVSVGALKALVRRQVSPILILFDNGAFGWIKGLHRLSGHKRCFGVGFTPPKGQAVAEAFDLKAWTATVAASLDAGLAEAFAWRKGPSFIDIRVESIADRVPSVYSWMMKRGRDPLALEAADVAYL